MVDWTIIQDSKTVPKIVLDVLINNKYVFDGFSISGGLIIIAAEIVWSVLSPNKKHAGEGIKLNEKEPLLEVNIDKNENEGQLNDESQEAQKKEEEKSNVT